MLDTKDYKNALRIFNTYCFSTATMVSRTRLKVTFIRTLPVLLAVKLGATHSKPVQGEDLTPELFESRRHNGRRKYTSFTKLFLLKVQTWRRCKYSRVLFLDGSFYDDSLLRPLSSRTEHSRLVMHHCRNSSVLSLLSALLALFQCVCISSYSILMQFY